MIKKYVTNEEILKAFSPDIFKGKSLTAINHVFIKVLSKKVGKLENYFLRVKDRKNNRISLILYIEPWIDVYYLMERAKNKGNSPVFGNFQTKK